MVSGFHCRKRYYDLRACSHDFLNRSIPAIACLVCWVLKLKYSCNYLLSFLRSYSLGFLDCGIAVISAGFACYPVLYQHTCNCLLAAWFLASRDSPNLLTRFVTFLDKCILAIRKLCFRLSDLLAFLAFWLSYLQASLECSLLISCCPCSKHSRDFPAWFLGFL